jgi:hypothetical protein
MILMIDPMVSMLRMLSLWTIHLLRILRQNGGAADVTSGGCRTGRPRFKSLQTGHARALHAMLAAATPSPSLPFRVVKPDSSLICCVLHSASLAFAKKEASCDARAAARARRHLAPAHSAV